MEMLYGLETSDILLALQRFATRRGLPVQMVSDNATYFKRAAKEIKEGLVFASVCSTSAWTRVEWRFNPPRAPHTGGMFEALIGSAKRATKAVLGTASLKDDELASAFVFVEGILNDRPLDFVSTDTNDLSPLTPAHFLSGPRVQESAFRDLKETSSFSRRWVFLSKIREQFWKRFVEEIKPGLGLRPKWHKERPPLKEGDVVVVLTDKNEYGRWPLARVSGTCPGSDGLVRVVRVRLGGKEITRHVNSVMRLL